MRTKLHAAEYWYGWSFVFYNLHSFSHGLVHYLGSLQKKFFDLNENLVNICAHDGPYIEIHVFKSERPLNIFPSVHQGHLWKVLVLSASVPCCTIQVFIHSSHPLLLVAENSRGIPCGKTCKEDRDDEWMGVSLARQPKPNGSVLVRSYVISISLICLFFMSTLKERCH